ncbi:GNAT family N-acetyltransferase [Hymenobacter sediminis]|uniref:GNAT family N-acetyltransferase n=1 Tax=Hymenobacter sediminis TaxID=2218621 RepID=UPI000DA6D0F4|nr:GNAT family N-acetyltransferase [Hymenobacter sediminis]RPD50127.1 GNAT family N-acetyltransferase [Hymenobacter sediminis]
MLNPLVPSIQPLHWDTQFFGFPVGRLQASAVSEPELQQVVQQARHDKWRLLYWFLDPADVQSTASARAVGASLLDRKVRFGRAVPETAPQIPAYVLPTPSVTPNLVDLAIQSAHYSRFRLDLNFPAGTYERLYENWIRGSVDGQLARKVLASYPPSAPEPLGLITLGYQPTHITIGLLAVQEGHRGKGIGRKLVEAGLHYAHTWQVPRIQVTTQLDNEGACRFYLREGFVQEHEEHVYHIWL